VTGRQLEAVGWSRTVICRRVRTGALHRRYRGVYAVGHTALTREGEWLAAVLACGPGAALASFSAAVLWGLIPDGEGSIHVTAERQRRAPAGVVLHRTASLPAEDVVRRDGIPVTSPERTLLDLAATAAPALLARAVEQAAVLELVRRDRLLERSANRPGAAALRAALATEPSLTRSEAERSLLELLRRAGLPRPRTNVRIGPFELDAYWPDHRLAAEIDGYAYHGHREAFERDRRRDAALQAAGIRVVRITWRELTRHRDRLIATLAALLSPATIDGTLAPTDPLPR
jgi:very-short-patch-repair endonuclease